MTQQRIKILLLLAASGIVFLVIGLALQVAFIKLPETKQSRLLINERDLKAIKASKGKYKQPLAIDIDVATNRLYLTSQGRIIKEYPVSTGKQKTRTPIGEFKITYKGIPNPKWTPDDPTMLGTRWMEFKRVKGGGMYGIHGTDEPHLIGLAVSHGCVRMRNKDVEELFEIIPKGTKVTIRPNHTRDHLKTEGTQEKICPAC